MKIYISIRSCFRFLSYNTVDDYDNDNKKRINEKIMKLRTPNIDVVMGFFFAAHKKKDEKQCEIVK